MPVGIGVGISPVLLSQRISEGLLLDDIPNILILSTRKLRTAYAGQCIRLRRSSDNAESDFGFAGDPLALDTVAISAWLGGANGFLTTYYDQSGNGYNATQSVAAQQPQYVAGVINGNPVFRFVKSNSQYLTLGTQLGKPANFTMFFTGSLTDVLATQAFILSSDNSAANSTSWIWLFNRNTRPGRLEWSFGDSSNPAITSFGHTTNVVISNNIFFLASRVYQSGNTFTDTYVDSGSLEPNTILFAAANASTGTAYDLSIGRAGEFNGFYLQGDVGTIIIDDSVFSTTDRETVEDGLMDIYGL